MRPLKLPGPNDQVNPGDVCTVAGWGKLFINATEGSALLEEAQLIIQEDEECRKRFHHYFKIMEICAGDPNRIEAPSKVGIKHFPDAIQGERVPGEAKVSEWQSPQASALVSYVGVVRMQAWNTYFT